jgi:hypothetical protein
MRRCSRKVLVLLLEIHPSVWLGLLVFVGANLVRLKLMDSPEDEGVGGFWPLLGMGWLLTLMAFVVHLKCRSIAAKLGDLVVEQTEGVDDEDDLVARTHKRGNARGVDPDVVDGDGDAYEMGIHHYLGDTKARCCGLCVTYRSKFSKLFWFRSPNFLLRITQVILLGQAMYLTLFGAVYLTEALNAFGWGSVLVGVLPVVLMLVFFLPSFLPTFTLVCISAANCSNFVP